MSLSIPDADQQMSLAISKKLLKSVKTKFPSNKRSINRSSIQKSKKKSNSIKFKVVANKSKKRNIEKKIQILASNKLLTCQNIKNTPNMEFVGEGVSNKVFIGCIDFECQETAAFRIMPISKKYPLNSKHPVNVEIKLYQKFNKLNSLYLLPHVPLMIKNFRCRYQDVLQDKEVLEEYLEKVEDREIDSQVNIMILEFCHGGPIGKFVDKYQKNVRYLRCAFFQLLLTITVLQFHLKNFRHNDLHSNNASLGLYGFVTEEIYLKSYKKTPVYIAYKILGRYFYLPYLGFCVKLIDFDVSCMDSVPNSKVSIDKVYEENGVTCKSNPVFDTHLILNSCTYKFFEKLMGLSAGSQTLHKDIVSFIDRNIPPHLRGFNTPTLGYARVKDTKKIPRGLRTPMDVILRDPLFSSYLEKPTNGKVIMAYDTKVPDIKELRKKRPDMFIDESKVRN